MGCSQTNLREEELKLRLRQEEIARLLSKVQNSELNLEDFEKSEEMNWQVDAQTIEIGDLDVRKLALTILYGSSKEDRVEPNKITALLPEISLYFISRLTYETSISNSEAEVFQELYFQIFDNSPEDDLEDMSASMGRLLLEQSKTETKITGSKHLLLLLCTHSVKMSASTWVVSCVETFARMQWNEECAVIFGHIIRNGIWTIGDILMLSKMNLNVEQFTCELSSCLLYSKPFSEYINFFNTILDLEKTNASRILRNRMRQEISLVTEMNVDEMDKDFEQLLIELKQKYKIREELEEKLIKIAKEVYSTVGTSKATITNTKNFERTFRSSNKSNKPLHLLSDVELKEDIKIVMDIVFDQMNYKPHANQVLCLVLLCLLKRGKQHAMFEVATGEGKSCIIAMFASIAALHNIKVDIITSSPILAKRDCEEWKPVYDKLGLTCAENITDIEEQHSTKEDIYKSDIIYGTVLSFAADILQEEFQMKETRADRGFNMCIIDEVDMLMLDQGVNFTYISQMATGLSLLEPLLADIWNLVSSFTTSRRVPKEFCRGAF